MNEFVLDTGHQVRHRLGRNVPDEALLRQRRHRQRAEAVPAQLQPTGGSCDDVSLNIYDREERTTSTPISVLAAAAHADQFDLLGSERRDVQQQQTCWARANSANIPTTFQNGWLNLGFPTGITGALPQVHELVNTTNTLITSLGGSTSSGNTVTYVGLPVVGFAVQTFSNGVLLVGQTARRTCCRTTAATSSTSIRR